MIYKKIILHIKCRFITELLPLVLIILSSISLLSCKGKENSADEIGRFIKLENITKKTSLIKFGYEAVIAVSTQNGIVLVDAGISNSLTTEYRKVIEQNYGMNDFAYLINTHSHWDHTGGNQVFADAVIIAHENCTSEMTEYWKDKEKIKAGVRKIIIDYENQLKNIDSEWQDSLEIKLQKIRFQHVLDDLTNDREVTLPTKVFEDTMNISMGDVNFNLKYFGKAHSNSDILIHIPEEKVLLVGDLFSEYGRPSIAAKNILDAEKCVEVKQWIEDRLKNIEVVIGGHGQIMKNKDLLLFIENIEKIKKE